MFAFFVNCWDLVEFENGTVHPDPHISLTLKSTQQLLVFSFTVLDDRCQQQQAAALWQRHDPINHLTDRACVECSAVFRAAGLTDPCVEQSQVIVDLGDSADGRAWIVGRGFLFDADGG